jgi:hypothetical protein
LYAAPPDTVTEKNKDEFFEIEYDKVKALSFLENRSQPSPAGGVPKAMSINEQRDRTGARSSVGNDRTARNGRPFPAGVPQETP